MTFALRRPKHCAGELIAVLALVASVLSSVVHDQAVAFETAGGGVYVPLTPTRIVNATTWTGGTGNFTAGETRSFQILGAAGVPASGVSAVVVDLAAHGTTTTGSSYLTAWASGATRPVVSSLYYTKENAPRSNTAVVPIGSNGKISVYSYAGTTSVTVDIQGYFTTSSTASSTGGFVALPTPVRIANTGTGQGVPQALIPVGGSVDIRVTGVGEIANDATAIFANVEASLSTAAGQLRVGPGGTVLAGAAAIDYGADGRYDSGGSIKLSSDGRMRITNSAGSTVNIKVDVQGYFSGNSAEGGSFTALSPVNVYSTTSSGQTEIAGGESRSVPVAGLVGIPAEAEATVLTVQVKNWTAGGTVAVYAADTEWPGTSNVGFNYNEGNPSNGLSSTAIVRLSYDGKVAIHNTSSRSVRVTLTAQGWFSRSRQAPGVDHGEAIEPTSTIYPGISSDELQDVEAIAANEGTSVAAAANQFVRQAEFDTLLTAVEEVNPDTFAYGELGDGSTSPKLGFTEPNPVIPSAAASSISSMNVAVVTNVPLSEQELGDAATSTAEAVTDVAGQDASVLVNTNSITGTISADVFIPTSVNPTEAQMATSAVAQIAADQPGVTVPGVTVKRVETAPYSPTSSPINGGVQIGGYGVGSCTSGFPVLVPGDYYNQGLITARHCKDTMRYTWWNPYDEDGEYQLQDTKKWLGWRYGDIEYHPTRDNVLASPWFYGNAYWPRLLKGKAAVGPSDRVCLFGRQGNPGGRCGTIVERGVVVRNPTVPGGTISNLTAIKGVIVVLGDSGGPVFIGNKAVGIISGYATCIARSTNVRYSCTLFTPIGALGKGGFNVQLKLAPGY